MANIKANIDGDVGGFEKFPEGVHTTMIDKFEFNKSKDMPNETNPLSGRIEFVHIDDQNLRISQFVNLDKPASMAKFITTLVKFGVAAKIAQQVPQFFSQDPVSVGWDDDYILEKGIDKKPIKMKDQFLFVMRQAINGAVGKVYVENDKEGNARIKNVFGINETPTLKSKGVGVATGSHQTQTSTAFTSPLPTPPVVLVPQQQVLWK